MNDQWSYSRERRWHDTPRNQMRVMGVIANKI